jgi:hypothetical protein
MNRQHQIDDFTYAFHQVAVERLADSPENVNKALATLQRWKDQRGVTASDLYLEEWRVLLTGEISALKNRVCAYNDSAATLRNVSPLGFLLTSAERQALHQQNVR